MKIVFFSSDNNLSSGAYRAQINLIKDLQKHGHNITLVLPYRWKGNKFAKSIGIKTRTFLSTPWVCHKNKNIFSHLAHWCSAPVNALAALRIKMFLKKHNFDLAVVNTLWNGIGGRQAIKQNIPIVWHIREILETGQDRSFYNNKKSISIIKKSKQCISVSESAKKYYDKQLPNLITNVYDGVDKNIFLNNKKQLFKENKTHFLMMGTVNKPKGQHLGLQALNELSQYDFDVKIVGKCKKAYKSKLLKCALNIKERIEFVKPTKQPQKYYQWADVFLMNSIGEAFGLVTAEAMMGGVVVVSSKCDGGLEIIESEQNGYFYKPTNWKDLKNKIEHILNNKSEAKHKALNGQKRSLEKFNKDLNSQTIEKIYKKYSRK